MNISVIYVNAYPKLALSRKLRSKYPGSTLFEILNWAKCPVFICGLEENSMAKDTATLKALIEPVITALGYRLWGAIYVARSRQALLRVYIDSDKGITVDDCQVVSRQLSAILDVEDPIPGQYTLEVSSPGLDRPLFTLDQYRLFIGHMVRIQLRMPSKGRRNFKGLLQAIEDDTVVIQVDGEEHTIAFATIERANIITEIG